jgi:glyoxylate reductase
LEAETGAEYRDFDALLRESDFVVMCAPLTDATRGMFGSREFDLMKNNAVFVNISRGQTVKEAELLEALMKGRPWAAGLDVFEIEPTTGTNPLLSLPNVVCTPHCGSSSIATRTGMGVLCARNLVAFFEGKLLLTPVKTG